MQETVKLGTPDPNVAAGHLGSMGSKHWYDAS